MIATVEVPWTDKTSDGYLIGDKRSRSLFNPNSGAWEPFAGPLQPPDINRLMVRPGPPMPFASITPWPFAGHALIWANVGDNIDGDQILAMRLKLDKDGNFAGEYPDSTPPWMDLSPAGPVQWADGSTMKPVARDETGRPTVPRSA